VPNQAASCLHSVQHAQCATTAFQDARNTSLEASHNSIHGIVGGIMASFQSSFHPVFWMHHCNVDRIYEKYIEIEPDSMREFQQHQKRRSPNPTPGFPEGPWGPYLPFKHPTTGRPFHARDVFDAPALGYKYDKLPKVRPPQMREPPYFAVFQQVDIIKLERPRNLHVFVAAKGADWSPPPVPPPPTSPLALCLARCLPVKDLSSAPGYAGSGTIFFFDTPGGCKNCKVNSKVDVYVDVTQALRRNKLRPNDAALHVLVEDSLHEILPLDQTPVPPPSLKGPRFSSMTQLKGAEAEEVAEVQAILKAQKRLEVCQDGKLCPTTEAAIKKVQKAARLKEDGKPGPVTKRALLVTGLQFDDFEGGLPVKSGGTYSWSIDADTVPKGLKLEGVRQELEKAFRPWAEAGGFALNFLDKSADPYAKVDVTIQWSERSSGSEFAFDGPGGALAAATKSSISFDASERWELSSSRHPHREIFDWDEHYFKLLPVAMHEMGHVLGLTHSDEPASVMSPYYIADRVVLSAEDKQRIKALVK